MSGGSIGSWVRGQCIGRGSFGTVHLATMNKPDTGDHVFAVKSVGRNTTSPSVAQECLENEIAILRTLSSPYVVNYFGDDVTWEEATTSYRNMHMEYLPGGTLADVSGQLSRYDERILRSYARCVVSALGYLHSRNITHCDVKGRNVLVGPGVGTCKLADFGSAKVVVLGDNSTTCEVSPRGSPMWMAPEVIRGEYQGPESDVWSLGCTVIEMMTGKPGWEDKGADTLCRIGFSEELPEVPSWMSEVGRDFMSKCLRREVSERWSCDQLLRHPFVSSSSSSSFADCIVVEEDASPRGVLDWVDSECDDDDELNSDCRNHNPDQYYVNSIGAKLRITELASCTSGSGAVWESDDGWLAVRDWNADDHHRDQDADAVDVLEYSNGTRPRAEEETKRGSLVEVNFGGNNFNSQQELRCRGHIIKCDAGTRIVAAAAAGSSCRHGLVNVLPAADGQPTPQNIGIYYVNCCCCSYVYSIQFDRKKHIDSHVYFCGNNKYQFQQFSLFFPSQSIHS